MPYSSEEDMNDSVSRAEHQSNHAPLPVSTNPEEQNNSEAELSQSLQRTRAASVADEPVVGEGKFSASREEMEDSQSETVEIPDDSLDKTATLMSAVHLDIPAIAFNAAKQGDSELLEVLLGPSLQNEKVKFIELSAKRQTREDQLRIYEFMYSITLKRLEEIALFDDMNPDYRDYKKLSKRLNDVIRPCVREATDRYAADQKPFGQCVELHDYSSRRVILDIDRMSHVDEARLTHTSHADNTSIKSFLMRHGVTFSVTDRYASFYLSEDIKKAMDIIWYDRFDHRGELMVFPVIETEQSYDMQKKVLINEKNLCSQYIKQCKDEIRELTSIIDAYALPYNARCKRQIALIDALLADKRYTLSPELITLINKVKVTILFKMGDPRYKHLAGAADEPKQCWVSPYIKDRTGSTMLHVAVQRKRYKSAYILQLHGLLLNTKNKKDKTPADLSGYEEDELNSIIQKYSRVTDSEFLKEAENIILAYLARSKKTLASVPRKLLYRIFNDIKILRTRVDEEIPRYQQQIQETRQALDDMSFALSARKCAKDSKRGIRNRSALHESILALVDRYLDVDNDYGVKPLDEVSRIGISARVNQAESRELVIARAESERQLQQILEQEGLIARLKGENLELTGKLDKAQDFAKEQSLKIASQDAKIDEQSVQIKNQADELKMLQSRVAQQGTEMQAMHDSIAQMQKFMLAMQGQQSAQQATPRATSPIPIAVRRVSVNPNTLYGSPTDAPLTSAFDENDIPMNSFSPSE